MKLVLAATVLASVAAVPASAQSMRADQFHQRATALKKKGPLALFSRGEIKVLMGEVKASADKARAQRLAALKAGRPARYCPPGDKGQIDAEDFMRRLSAIPPAERARIDMTEATTRVLASKYPCQG